MRVLILIALALCLSVSAGEKHLYLLPEPMETSVELGPVAETFHYASQTLWQVFKAAMTGYVTGHPSAGVGILAFDLVKMTPYITAQSMLDLRVRYWWKRRKLMTELSRIPGAKKVYFIRGSTTEFRGLVAKRQNARALMLIETDRRLPDELPKWGRPVEVTRPEEMKLNLRLLVDGEAREKVWNTTLKEILDRERMPKEVADRWRADAKEAKKGSAWWDRVMHRTPADRMKIAAALVDKEGNELALGAIFEGLSAKKFLKMTLLGNFGWRESALPLTVHNCSGVLVQLSGGTP